MVVISSGIHRKCHRSMGCTDLPYKNWNLMINYLNGICHGHPSIGDFRHPTSAGSLPGRPFTVCLENHHRFLVKMVGVTIVNCKLIYHCYSLQTIVIVVLTKDGRINYIWPTNNHQFTIVHHSLASIWYTLVSSNMAGWKITMLNGGVHRKITDFYGPCAMAMFDYRVPSGNLWHSYWKWPMK